MHVKRSRLVWLWIPLLVACSEAPPPATDTETAGNLGELLGSETEDGFARAEAPRSFQFPADHGAHPTFRNEWWYFTGNLADPGGRLFGYQLVIFRNAVAPRMVNRSSAWATNQIYMAHFALTDVAGRDFQYFERFARGAMGLAGATTAPLRIWLEDWEIRGTDGGWHLRARSGDHAIDLQLIARKPIVLQGERGLSRKSERPGHASYYYSQTRLETRGTLRLPAGAFEVAGWSWLDREWSSSALAPDQVGWDWFALQLEDGFDLMFYRLRREDGSMDPASSGTLVDPEGHTTHLRHDQVRLTALDHWRSPRGGRYPLRWHLGVLDQELELEITPLLEDQELDATVRYWEGAVSVQGHHRGLPVRGRGYVELTGY